MVEARNVRFAVGAKALLESVTVEFAPGRLHLIVGANGAGKSTLVKLLARLLRPSAGEVRYAGSDIATASDADLARRRAVLSQAVELAFPLSAREVVGMGRYPHHGAQPTADDLAIIDDVMRDLDVTDLADRIYPTLSGGERQRVNFARVLAQVWRPVPTGERVLLLDEPLTFLDVGHQLEFLRQIRGFAAQPDIVVIGVVHDLNLAWRFADDLVLLQHGRLIAAGVPDAVLTPANVREAFGVSVVVADVPGVGRQLVFD